ncbi:MAG TPA: class I SAM-dependent methyltransferase [Candidatus Nanoarchaeia archaeon]|nr:class I SAM-dependent methyltransferase [Candidatus Nanoarchaeia archaeon]
MQDFTRFFSDKNYILLKNYLFNYLNRKRLIKAYTQCKTPALDIGSGISPVTPYKKKTIYLDISPEAIKHLKKQGYEAHIGSVTDIKLPDNSVNTLYCSEVLEHVEDYQQALKEFFRILKPGAPLYITVPCWMHLWNNDDEFVGHYRRFDPHKLQAELSTIGFKHQKKKAIGSFFERKLTIFLVKHFKEAGKINPLFIPPYIIANYLLSWFMTFSSFFSPEKSTSIFLFIARKP